MKFYGTPQQEIFSPSTKQTLGFFDEKGVFETKDRNIILQMGREELGSKKKGEAKGNDNESKKEGKDMEPREYFSQCDRETLLENAAVAEIEGADKMSNEELVDALVGVEA